MPVARPSGLIAQRFCRLPLFSPAMLNGELDFGTQLLENAPYPAAPVALRELAPPPLPEYVDGQPERRDQPEPERPSLRTDLATYITSRPSLRCPSPLCCQGWPSLLDPGCPSPLCCQGWPSLLNPGGASRFCCQGWPSLLNPGGQSQLCCQGSPSLLNPGSPSPLC